MAGEMEVGSALARAIDNMGGTQQAGTRNKQQSEGRGVGGGCALPFGNMPGMPYSAQGDDMQWGTYAKVCPNMVDKWLLWFNVALCSFNLAAFVAAVLIQTNTAVFPHPAYDFNIGPDNGQQPMGVNFPREWCGEMLYHGAYRFKCAFAVTVTHGVLTPDAIAGALFGSTLALILQQGTEDKYTIAMNFGLSEELKKSDLVPAFGGYYVCAQPFVCFGIAPELQSLQLRGKGPGNVMIDNYEATATFTTQWRQLV